MNEAERYKAQSLHYLNNAFASIEAGEAEKAGEFLWGSIAEALKAVAASKGMELESHAKLWRYAQALAKEMGDKAIYNVFALASSLHKNFYESGLDLKDVSIQAQDIKAMVEKLLGLISEDKAKV